VVSEATEHNKIALITREIRGPITSFGMLVVLVIMLAILGLSNSMNMFCMESIKTVI